MHLISNGPARFLATAKTQKLNQIENINIQDLKLRPIIINQTSSYICNASEVSTKYFKPFAKNDFTMSDTCAFHIC